MKKNILRLGIAGFLSLSTSFASNNEIHILTWDEFQNDINQCTIYNNDNEVVTADAFINDVQTLNLIPRNINWRCYNTWTFESKNGENQFATLQTTYSYPDNQYEVTHIKTAERTHWFRTLETGHFQDLNGHLKNNLNHTFLFPRLCRGNWDSLSQDQQGDQIDQMVSYGSKLAGIAADRHQPDKELYYLLAGLWMNRAYNFSENSLYDMQAKLYLQFALQNEVTYPSQNENKNEKNYLSFLCQMSALRYLESWTHDKTEKFTYLTALIEKVETVLENREENQPIPAPKSLEVGIHYTDQDGFRTMFTDLAYSNYLNVVGLSIYPKAVLESIENYKHTLEQDTDNE